jgi:hypothetical protein
MDHNDKNKITGIDNIDIITNGTADQFKTITNADQVGHIIDKTTQNILSETTPLFMMIVQHRRGWEELLNILVQNGGNLDRQINFWGNQVSARQLLQRKEALRDAAQARAENPHGFINNH